VILSSRSEKPAAAVRRNEPILARKLLKTEIAWHRQKFPKKVVIGLASLCRLVCRFTLE